MLRRVIFYRFPRSELEFEILYTQTRGFNNYECGPLFIFFNYWNESIADLKDWYSLKGLSIPRSIKVDSYTSRLTYPPQLKSHKILQLVGNVCLLCCGECFFTHSIISMWLCSKCLGLVTLMIDKHAVDGVRIFKLVPPVSCLFRGV